jgi:hypothetical protein
MYIFPDNPNTGDVVTGPNDTSWKWDGVKWVGGVDGPFVDLNGDTMTGPLFLDGNPTLPFEAATKDYVDHVESNDVHEAPFDGQAYGRELGDWTPVLPITGGIMRGGIDVDGWEINGVPTPLLPLQAVNKAYVDNAISGLQAYLGTWQVADNIPDLTLTAGLPDGGYYIATTDNPADPEFAPANIPGIGGQSIQNGSLIVWNAKLAIWQVVVSGQLTRNQADALYLPLIGGTLTGPLILAADPAQSQEAATKHYVDKVVAEERSSFAIVSDTPPPLPVVGQLWWDSVSGQLYISYQDPNSTEWVIANNFGGDDDDTSGGGSDDILEDAPSDDTVYGRENATWVHVLPLSGGTIGGPLTISGSGNFILTDPSDSHVTFDRTLSSDIHQYQLGTDTGKFYLWDATGDQYIYTFNEATSTFQLYTPVSMNLGLTVGQDLTVGGNISGGVIANNSTTSRSLADRFADSINVQDFGAKGDGANDDTQPIINAFLAVPPTGGVVVFPMGDYLMSGAATIYSNTYVVGFGAKIIAAPPGSWSGGSIFGVLDAANNASNIVIDGLKFAYPYGNPNYGPAGTAHIMTFNLCTNVLVKGCFSDGGGDFAAFVGCTDTLCIGNEVTNVSNAAFDHWGGYNNAKVIGNTASSLPTAGVNVGLIQFTGLNTDGSAANSVGAIATGNILTFNTTFGGQAIEINGHATAGTNDKIIIADNKIVLSGNIPVWGILVTGMGNNIDIHDNELDGAHSTSYSAIGVFTPATNVHVHDNIAINWDSTTDGVFANTAVGGTIISNRAYACLAATVGSVAATTVVYDNDTGTGTLNINSPVAATQTVTINAPGTFSTYDYSLDLVLASPVDSAGYGPALAFVNNYTNGNVFAFVRYSDTLYLSQFDTLGPTATEIIDMLQWDSTGLTTFLQPAGFSNTATFSGAVNFNGTIGSTITFANAVNPDITKASNGTLRFTAAGMHLTGTSSMQIDTTNALSMSGANSVNISGGGVTVGNYNNGNEYLYVSDSGVYISSDDGMPVFIGGTAYAGLTYGLTVNASGNTFQGPLALATTPSFVMWDDGSGFNVSGSATDATIDFAVYPASEIDIGPMYVQIGTLGYNTFSINTGATADADILLQSSVGGTTGGIQINWPRLGFGGTTPIAKPDITGAKGGNTALASLIAGLVAYGLFTDSSTA